MCTWTTLLRSNARMPSSSQQFATNRSSPKPSPTFVGEAHCQKDSISWKGTAHCPPRLCRGQDEVCETHHVDTFSLASLDHTGSFEEVVQDQAKKASHSTGYPANKGGALPHLLLEGLAVQLNNSDTRVCLGPALGARNHELALQILCAISGPPWRQWWRQTRFGHVPLSQSETIAPGRAHTLPIIFATMVCNPWTRCPAQQTTASAVKRNGLSCSFSILLQSHSHCPHWAPNLTNPRMKAHTLRSEKYHLCNQQLLLGQKRSCSISSFLFPRLRGVQVGSHGPSCHHAFERLGVQHGWPGRLPRSFHKQLPCAQHFARHTPAKVCGPRNIPQPFGVSSSAWSKTNHRVFGNQDFRLEFSMPNQFAWSSDRRS